MQKLIGLFEVIVCIAAFIGATVILSNYASATDVKMGKTSGRKLLPPEESSTSSESTESTSEESSSEEEPEMTIDTIPTSIMH